MALFNLQHRPQPPKYENLDDLHHIFDPLPPQEQGGIYEYTDAAKKYIAAETERFDLFTKGRIKEKAAENITKIWEQPSEDVWECYGDKYFSFYDDGKLPQPVYRIRHTIDGKPQILIDPNNMQNGELAVQLKGAYPSPNGKSVIYITSVAGNDEETIRICDEKGRDLSDIIEHCLLASVRKIQWDRDGAGFTYSYPIKINNSKCFVAKHHTIGQSSKEDTLVFNSSDKPVEVVENAFYLTDQKGMQGQYDFISSTTSSNKATAIYYKKHNEDNYRLLFNDGKSSLIPIGEVNDKIYAITNFDAPLNRLVEINPKNPEPQNWHDIIKANNQDLMKWVKLHKGLLIAGYYHDGADKITIHDLKGEKQHDIPIPVQSAAKLGHINENDDELLMRISSYQFPGRMYGYNLKTQNFRPLKEADAKLDLSDTIVERIYATMKDGTSIPMTVVRPVNVKLDGTAALKLRGYGGFNSINPPAFGIEMYNWVKEGGIYVWATLPGDGDLGKEYYEKGIRINKQNTFDAFIACGEYLTTPQQGSSERYTSPQRLAIQGGSQGGLLVLVCAQQRPDLFGSVVADEPPTNMLNLYRYISTGSAKSEYGDPDASKEEYETIKRYSPLQNIQRGKKYPPILVKASGNDTRVVSSHATAFTAAEQEACPDSLCLLRFEERTGHGVGRSRQEWIDNMADTHAFIEKTIGPIDQRKYNSLYNQLSQVER